MTEPEWIKIVASMNGWWPHSVIPTSAARMQFPFVAAFLAIDVLGAAETRYVSGDQYPPTAGQLVQMLRARINGSDDELWAEVWRELLSSASLYGANQRQAVDANGFPVGPQLPAIDAIPWTSPEVQNLARLMGWQEFCSGQLGEPAIVQAQTREKWRELRDRDRRQAMRGKLPAIKLPAASQPAEEQLTDG